MTTNTDGFDISPQYSRNYPGRYSATALFELAPIRDAAASYRPRFAAVPEDTGAVIAARSSYNGQLWLKPNSVIWGFRGIASQPEGFRVQILEPGTGEKFFGTPQRLYKQTTNDATVNTMPVQTFLLPVPRVVIEPGLLTVEIVNLSNSSNNVQFLLCYAEPIDSTSPGLGAVPNAIDQQGSKTRALRNAGILQASTGAAATTEGPAPWTAQPAQGMPFRYAQTMGTPAAGAAAVTVCSFSVPNGYDCAIKSISNEYTGAGFQPGTGDLTFRIKIDGAYLRGYDSITTMLGSSDKPYSIAGAIRARAGQLVEYTVEQAATSPLAPSPSAYCIASFAGWFYPAS